MTTADFSSVPDTASSTPDRRRAATSAVAVMGGRILLLALAWAVCLGLGRLTHVAGDQWLLWMNVAIIPVDLACIALVLWRLRRDGSTLSEIWSFRPADIGWSALALLLVPVAFLASNFVANVIVYGGAPPATGGSVHVPLWIGILSLTVMPVTVAVAEELVYRGYGQRRCTQASNRWAAWVVVALFFAVQHAFLTPLAAQPQLARFLTTLLAGLAFGALVWWWKRLTPLIVGHWALDVIGLGLPVFLASIS